MLTGLKAACVSGVVAKTTNVVNDKRHKGPTSSTVLWYDSIHVHCSVLHYHVDDDMYRARWDVTNEFFFYFKTIRRISKMRMSLQCNVGVFLSFSFLLHVLDGYFYTSLVFLPSFQPMQTRLGLKKSLRVYSRLHPHAISCSKWMIGISFWTCVL